MTNIRESVMVVPNPMAVYWYQSGVETKKLMSSESGGRLMEMAVLVSGTKSEETAVCALVSCSCVTMPGTR